MLFRKDYYKVANNPFVYQINLLKPSNWVYFSFYYKAGHIFNRKPNNLPHLFEHYFSTFLINRGIPEDSIKAYTDEEFIEFDFRFSRKEIAKYFEIIIKAFTEPDFSYQDILE